MTHYKNFSSTLTTSEIPSNVTEVIRGAAIEKLKEISNLRQFGIVNRLDDEGSRTYTYNYYGSLSDAYDRVENTDFKYNDVELNETTVNVEEIAQGFKLSWKADHSKKLAIRAANTKSAIDTVKDREDYKIMTALIASSALTSTVSATAVLSATTADPIADIDEMCRKVRALMNVNPDTLFIESVNLGELKGIVGSNDWGKITAGVIEKNNFPVFMGLKIVSVSSTKLTHGTAVAIVTGNMSPFEVGIAHEVKLNVFDDNDKHTTKVQLYENIAIAVSRPDAGAKLTGW